MSDIELSVESNGRLEAIIKQVSRFGEFVDGVVREAVTKDISPILLPAAQAEPGPVARPIEWTSPKQRRYVMMMIMKGLIPAPYIRTHALSQAWAFTVTTEPNVTQVTLANSASKFRYVEGLDQQQFHKNTAWLTATDRIPAWTDITVEKLTDALHTAWGGI